MSNFEYDDNDYGDGNDLVSQLRRALKAKDKEAKEAQAKVEELTKTNAELSGKVRGVSLSEILKAKGAKPAMAKFMTDVEPTEDAVTAWLAENGELFGFDPNAKTDPPAGEAPSGQNTPQGEAPALPPEMQAALEAMSAIQKQEASAVPGSSTGSQVDDFISRVGQNAGSFEDVERAFREAGITGNL
jgi:hypothetical protein